MCGIAGIVRRTPIGVSPEMLARMAAAMRHRGPDGFGIYAGARAGLAHVRLSIIDLSGGAQPLGNEDGSLLVTFNGEIYNFVELRRELQRAGHHFRTSSDTEVLVHGYEEWGPDMLRRLNGQFAFAILDRRSGELFMARDLFGVHPLFYCRRKGDFYFASEAKALFATGEVEAAPDHAGLDEVYTLWGARAPRTVFRDIQRLEPGCFAILRDGELTVTRYHVPSYEPRARSQSDAIEELDALLTDSVRLRLRADVPVGGYLSGGLDSAVTCTLAAAASPHRLRTFSVAFEDPALDERAHQATVATELGSLHSAREIGATDVADLFPSVVRHLETPVVRTGAAPLFALSKLTREQGIKVVLTGEGSDEIFLGYDLFKEVVVRRFCLADPTSRLRPKMFDRLYPYLGGRSRSGDFWRQFFINAGSPDDPLFSHQPRIKLTSRIKDFLAPDARAAVGAFDACDELRSALPREFDRWSPLAQAAHIEITTLLEPYLLASQGDRMSMAHGVEARYPFLDPRLLAFATSLPDSMKLRGFDEKRILRDWARGRIPKSVAARPKQPYRAPDAPSFFGPDAPAWVRELLEPRRLRDAGIFDPERVAGLTRRCQSGKVAGFGENQAVVAILSTQLWHDAFISAPSLPEPLPLDRADVFFGDEPQSATGPGAFGAGSSLSHRS
jgi:asparagine synthase (glutamine-hydrolysing)